MPMTQINRRIFGMITTSASAEYTPVAMSTFFKHTPFSERQDEFLLIDNNSSYTGEIPPYVKLIRNTAPLGFAANMNQVLIVAKEKMADAFLLNNDLAFTKNWSTQFTTDSTSILSPLSNRELQYDTNILNTRVAMQLDEYLGNEEALDEIVRQHQQQNQTYFNALVLPFFAVRIPFAVIEKVGELDPSFGLGGGEDYDYCLRAHLAGFEIKYALGSYILHFGGKSSWSGAESQKQQLDRELKFKTTFREKWGEKLLDLILNDAESIVSENPELTKALQAGDYKTIITALKASI